jgi:hypothetical protein
MMEWTLQIIVCKHDILLEVLILMLGACLALRRQVWAGCHVYVYCVYMYGHVYTHTHDSMIIYWTHSLLSFWSLSHLSGW